MFRLDKRQVEEMIAHARAKAPQEACGVLAGPEGRVERVYRTTNVERSGVRYRLDPQEQYEILIELEQRGWELVGIYHSHPASEAYPSATDLEWAFYPDSLYFIVSLADEERPVIRAFRIVEGEVREEEIIVE
ncbi:MAG: Mov34/MPN/PAD-1 family protein [Anaerolineae bacterium]